MFLELVSLGLFLLLTATGLGIDAIENEVSLWSLLASGLLWMVLLALVYLQNRYLYRCIGSGRIQLIARLEILSVLAFIVFELELPRQLVSLPHLLPINSWIACILSLLYFSAIFLSRQTQAFNSLSGFIYLRFLLPLIYPFAVMVVFIDLLAVSSRVVAFDSFAFLLGLLTLIPLILYTFPHLLLLGWGCSPLSALQAAPLNQVCEREGIKHRGFFSWDLFAGMPNAAIVGVFPGSRYFLLTPKLIQGCDSECLSAVIAHEIGHVHYHHLFLYQLILGGGGVAIVMFEEYVDFYLSLGSLEHYTLIALLFSLYFRYVFGFFSRLFERQADLYPIALGIKAESMRRALDTIGHLAGGIHAEPSWHHYGISERMHYLKKVEEQPSLIVIHNRRVKRWVALYTVTLILIIILCEGVFIST